MHHTADPPPSLAPPHHNLPYMAVGQNESFHVSSDSAAVSSSYHIPGDYTWRGRGGAHHCISLVLGVQERG